MVGLRYCMNCGTEVEPNPKDRFCSPRCWIEFDNEHYDRSHLEG